MGSMGRRNTFWSNMQPGGKVVESEANIRLIGRAKKVPLATLERWGIIKRNRAVSRETRCVD